MRKVVRSDDRYVGRFQGRQAYMFAERHVCGQAIRQVGRLK